MARDQRAALEGIAAYIEEHVPMAAYEAEIRLRAANVGDDRQLRTILSDYAMAVLAAAYEALEASGIEMFGRPREDVRR